MHATYTLPQLRQIEQKAEQAGIDLMQRAARSIADWVTQHYSQQDTILIAVGTGNNGGDALWTALNLDARDYHVILFIPHPVKSSAALTFLSDKPALHNDKGLALAGETIVDTLDLPKSLRP